MQYLNGGWGCFSEISHFCITDDSFPQKTSHWLMKGFTQRRRALVARIDRDFLESP